MSTEKLTTIRLGGQLGQRFGKVHRFYVSSAAEAIRALSSQIEGFAAYLGDEKRQTMYKVYVANAQIDPEKELHMESGHKEVRISPIPQGAKRGGLFQVVLGAALIGMAFWTGGASMAAWGFGSKVAFSAGLSLALGGVASLLSPQPQLSLSDAPENTPNKNFSGPVNTVSAGRPVPIVYGRGIVGSATISAGIYSSDINSLGTNP